MTTFYLDYENGNDNYGGTSFDVLYSGTNGRISNSYTFSAATANFPNDGTLVPIKNVIGTPERFDNNNAWSIVGVTAVGTGISSPISGSSVWLITENSVLAQHYTRPNVNLYFFTISAQYTVSYYVKDNGCNKVVIRWGGLTTKAARFNLSNGTVEQVGASATASIQDVGSGWYRISLTTTAAGNYDIIDLGLTDNTYTGLDIQTYTGNGRNGIYISAPQLEAGSSVTTYEKPPEHCLSIWNGSSYSVYYIVRYVNSTTLIITGIQGGSAIANQAVDRQYYIGGRLKTFEGGPNAARTMAGDTVRVMASPNPTLVGNATFTSAKAEGGLSIQSSTNASPISITRASHGYATGDIVVVAGHTTNTNANGTWQITVTGVNTFTLNGSTGNGTGAGTGTVRRINNCVVSLANPVTQNIASFGNVGEGRTAWVASTNASCLLDLSDTKQGNCSDYIGVTAAFTTGKAGYKTLSSTLDLSGYQQLSFWIKLTSGNLNTGNSDVSLVLCSDSVGNVPVNTFNIPPLRILNRWTPITVNLGTNLGSSINSVALYINTDLGAQVYYVSNIIACKSASSNDSLNLTSLIGKNTVDEKWWAPIQSINGTRIILDQDSQALPSSAVANFRGYDGVSETTSLYKRETIKTPLSISNTAYTQQILVDTGYDGFLTKIECGYDRTNMSSITGESFFDGQNAIGVGVWLPSRNYVSVINLGVVRYFTGFQPQSSSFLSFNNHWYVGNNGLGCYYYNIFNSTSTNIIACFNWSTAYYVSVGTTGLYASNVLALSNGQGFGADYSPRQTLTNSTGRNNNVGLNFNHCINVLVSNCLFINNSNQGMGTGGSGSHNVMFLSCTTTNNSYSVSCAGHGINFVKNCTLNEASEALNFSAYSNGRTIFVNNDNTIDNYFYGIDFGTIYNTALVRQSNVGFAWALAPTSTARSASYPLDLPIAKIAVSANSLVTIKAWVRRTNTLLTMGLRLKGGQIAGVTNDITSYMSGPADTWEQITLTFTPTEKGVVEVLAECYGGSTYTGYVDNLTITQ